MGPLETEAHRLTNASLANSTQAIYRHRVSSFEFFRKKLGVNDMWPAPVAHVIAYKSQMSIDGKAPSTISTYISAIAFVHKINGWTDPTDNFIVQKLKEGCKRLKGNKDSRRPITLSILRQLCSLTHGICSTQFEAIMFKAAFVLAFLGFLRVGEITNTSQKGQGGHNLGIRDV